MQRRDKSKHELTCTHCGHIWNTTSKLLYVTCPSCRSKTPNKPTRRIPLTPEAELTKKVLKHK